MVIACRPGLIVHVVFLEPFYGGSHRSIVDHYIKHSSHSITLITLPARHWKWRLRGSAYHFARELRSRFESNGEALPDVVLSSSLTDLSLLKSLWAPATRVPVAKYIHEHQFAYPNRSGLTPDANYPLTDFASAASADWVFFNSSYCLETFFEGARKLFSRMPDARCAEFIDEVRARSSVLYPGGNPVSEEPTERNDAPVILWNHRWEHDKCPEVFFEAISKLDRPDLRWRLAVTGSRYRGTSDIFDYARSSLDERVVQWGYIRSVAAYRRLIANCDIVVSSAKQENFGLSVLEAVRAGLLPVLPRALSYKELYGELRAWFYDADGNPAEELARALEAAVQDSTGMSGQERARRSRWARQFDWSNRAPVWDEELSRLHRTFSAYGI